MLPPFIVSRPRLFEGRERDVRGFSLVEAMVATVIAVIAVLALAYSIGQGRAMIGQFEISRAALATAQSYMETLSMTPSTDSTLALNSQHFRSFDMGGSTVGQVEWDVAQFDDPSDGSNVTGNPKKVVINVTWTQGLSPGSVTLSRLF